MATNCDECGPTNTNPTPQNKKGDISSPLKRHNPSKQDKEGAGSIPLKRPKSDDSGAKPNDSPVFSSNLSLEDIRRTAEEFADARNWNQFHSPRNLALALVGEVGELAECFQWKGEVQPRLPGWSETERQHVGEELSDVLIYLIRLADKCGVDLPAAVMRKFEINGKKYPAIVVSGSNKKYTEYKVNGNKLSASEGNTSTDV